MAGDESAEVKENQTVSGAVTDGASSSESTGSSLINLEPFGKALGRSGREAPPPLRSQPTAKRGSAANVDSYDLAGDAEELPSVHAFKIPSRSTMSTQPTAQVHSSTPRSSHTADANPLSKTVRLLALAAAILAVTNAITAYKLFSRGGGGQETASASPPPQAKDTPKSSSTPDSTLRPITAHSQATLDAGSGWTRSKPADSAVAAGKAIPSATPEPDLPPAMAAHVADVQEWDPARFRKARIVEAACSVKGATFTFHTPGCTSFVKFPADALPDSLAQTPGETPDVFRITRAKVAARGDEEPLIDCTMHGGTDIQIQIGKQSGIREDLLRHSATILAVAKLRGEEILYVCDLPDSASPGLQMYLSAVPETLLIVPAIRSDSRNPQVLVPHAKPGSLVVKYRKSRREAWSNLDLPADLVIPRVGKVAFTVAAGLEGKGLKVTTEPDKEFSDQARKCGPLPRIPSGVKTASFVESLRAERPELEQVLQIRNIAEGYSVRIEDAAGRKLAAFRLALALPQK